MTSFVPFTGARRILLLCDKLLPASPAPTAPLAPVRRSDATLSADWVHALFGSLSAAITTSQAKAAAEVGVKVEPVTVEVVAPDAPAAAAASGTAGGGAFSCLGDSCVQGRAPCYNSGAGGPAGPADPNESACAAAQRDPAAAAMGKAVARLLQAQVLHYGVVRGAATSVGSGAGTGTGVRPPLTVCVVGTSLTHLTALQQVSRSSGKSIFTILIDPRASANAAMRFECASKYGVQMVTHVPGDAATAIGQVLACYGRIQIGAPGPRHPTGQQLVECPYCPMHDLTPDQLWLHMPLYHITDTRNDPAVCPICRVHSEREPLARHVHNEHAPAGVHVEKTRSVPLYSYGLCVIRRPRDGRYLVVQEFSGSGFWLPGGSIDPGEVPWQAAARECLEEAGVRIRLTGLLRVEAQPHKGYARLRFIFFGEPEDPEADAKTLPDHESAGACWVSLKELTERGGVRLRGPEPLEWFRYIDAGGTIHPISIMGHEGDPPPPVVRPAHAHDEDGHDGVEGADVMWNPM